MTDIQPDDDLTHVEVPDLPVPARRPRRRFRGLLIGVGVVVVVALLLGGAGVVWAKRQIDPPGHRGALINVVIPDGASTSKIASILAADHVIHSASVFRFYLKLKGGGPFQAGAYRFPTNDNYNDVIAILNNGPQVALDRITIPEGFTLHQIAARVGKLPGLSAAKFLAAAQSGVVRSRLEPPGSNNLEGLLQADTYFVQPDEDEVSILRRMVEAFDQTTADAGVDSAAAGLGVTPYQVVIVASMVEREAKLEADRGPIASVIYNRLRKGIPLGIDATLLYGLNKSTLTETDLRTPNPYNTRLIKGLPPTPIASPGRPSLDAAVSPPQTNYLYYVLTDPSGKHSFTDNYADFLQLEAEARKKGLL
ncbi:MAG TPA: endolytic transglycosylase MltG [Thermoleophilia bacterium]|nr:endolytic transglycosylase MltG [Thermoleophilia bacterium]